MSFLNLETGVGDKEIFWETIRSHDGWKCQQNKITGHYRIINPKKIRKAWGTDKLELLEKFDEYAGVHKIQHNATGMPQQEPERVNKAELYAELKSISELLETGAITDSEHARLKQKVLTKIESLD